MSLYLADEHAGFPASQDLRALAKYEATRFVQVFGLADVDYLAVPVLHQVDARLIGNALFLHEF